MPNSSPEQELDSLHLTDLVRKALDRPGLQVTDWKVKPLQGGFEFDSAIFRYQGEARDHGEAIPWSLILKVIKPSAKSKDPGGIWYWKREALAYQSGMLQRLPGGNVTAPACYETEERPDGSLWLWLEDIRDDINGPWPVEQYGIAARHLGQFNGAYLAGQELPTEPWITRNWLRKYVENAAPMAEFVRREPNHPVVMNVYPGDTLAQVLAIWDEREHILEVLERLPQVFCHQDAFRRNLFARARRTVAIDWGYMGVAPLGAELAALVAGSLGFYEIPAERVKELDRSCFEGYLQGLDEAGWKGDPRLVRSGYVISLMLRYPIAAHLGQTVPMLFDQDGRSKLESTFEGKTAAELEKADPAIVAYYQGILPEALKILGMKRLLSIVARIGIHSLRLRARRKNARTAL